MIDAINVRKAGKPARENGQLWRIHAALTLSFAGHPGHFSAFELTDEEERLEQLHLWT